MNKLWSYIAIFFSGIVVAFLYIFKNQKPQTKITNNVKNKKTGKKRLRRNKKNK